MHDQVVESLNIEGFGDHFQPEYPAIVIRIAFQNCGPQPQWRHGKKVQDVSMVMCIGKYGVMLVAEHRLNLHELQTQQGWHNQKCIAAKGTFT